MRFIKLMFAILLFLGVIKGLNTANNNHGNKETKAAFKNTKDGLFFKLHSNM